MALYRNKKIDTKISFLNRRNFNKINPKVNSRPRFDSASQSKMSSNKISPNPPLHYQNYNPMVTGNQTPAQFN